MVRKSMKLVSSFFAALCLTCVLLTVSLTRSSPASLVYDPWADLNDDGVINILDVVLVTSRYGATGTPITKAAMAYDSGWLNITDKQGQAITATHNLNIQDWNNQSIMVDITGRKTPTSPIQRLGTGTPFNKTYGGTSDDCTFSVVQTGDGGYALTGRTKSFGAGNYDFYLVKTDGYGSVEWRSASVYVVDWGVNTMTLYRAKTNTDWNYVRIRISIVKKP